MKQTALILLIFLSQTGFSQENDKGKLMKKLGYTVKLTYEIWRNRFVNEISNWKREI